MGYYVFCESDWIWNSCLNFKFQEALSLEVCKGIRNLKIPHDKIKIGEYDDFVVNELFAL